MMKTFILGKSEAESIVFSASAPGEHPVSTRSASDEGRGKTAVFLPLFGRFWRFAALLMLLLTIGVGNAWGTDVTYTFTSKSWAATLGDWTSGKDGNALTAGQGVQITTGTSGANATSSVSFADVSQVVVTYSTNASSGAGEISVKIGDNSAHSKSITKTGGTTDRTLTYDLSPTENGNITISITCTENSIYIKSIKISYSPTSIGTGTINFGNTSGYTKIDETPKNGLDNLGNIWTVTTIGTTSFTPNTSYCQIGSASKQATSITFTTTLSESVKVTSLTAKFGGFSGTAGTITLKVGDTSVGTGSLSGTSDVTISNSSSAVGTVLTVTVTGISKGVKAYYISYTTASSCTDLDAINGSITWNNPTEAEVTWDIVEHVDSWTLEYSDDDGENWTEAFSDKTSSDSEITEYDSDDDSTNDRNESTISGLSCNTDYVFRITANPATGYCEKDETLDNSGSGYNSGKWSVSYTFTDSKASKTEGPDAGANVCGDFDATFVAVDGYHLPDDIIVTIGGETKTIDEDYLWDDEDGYLIIDETAIDGNIAITVTALEDACPSFAFWYGTTMGSENNYECFSQVGTSTKWLTDLWTIPSTDQWTYVGNPEWITTYSGNLQLSNMKYALNRACALGTISTNVMEGAEGYIRIYSDNTGAGENKYVGFIPAGYVLRWGTDGGGWTSKAFYPDDEDDIEEEDWNTALQTWTSSNAAYYTYVGLQTSSDFVWSNRSETRRPVFLKPNSNWLESNAKFVMYYWDNSSHTGYSAIMTDPDGDGIYEAWIPSTYSYTNVIFGRLNPVQVDPVVNWDNKWNKTVDLTLPSDKNLFTITGGSDQSYTGEWSLYDKKGTFHISANSNTYNWYCHFLPHHVLHFDANGGSGAPADLSVAVNASPCQLTVPATEPTRTGYTFLGWAEDDDAEDKDDNWDPEDTHTMSDDVTLYAVWQAKTITLALKKNNSDASGSSDGSATIKYDDDTKTTLSAATRTGYSVEGYYSENTCTAANKVLTDKGDVVNSTVSGYTTSGKWTRTTTPTDLYAKWTPNEYTISLNDQSATTSASISSITATFNDDDNLTGTVVATLPTKTDYTFGGYFTAVSGGGVKIIDTDGTVVAGVASYTDADKNWIYPDDVELYAWWKPSYTITWMVGTDALTGDALDGASTTVVHGEQISGVPSTAPADNTLNNCANKFMGWSTTNITKGSPVTSADAIAALGLFTEASGYTTAITEATTFYAVFAERVGAAENTVIWQESFDGYSHSDKPTAPSETKGATIYSGANIEYNWYAGTGVDGKSSYITTDNGGNLAGGTSPEAIIGYGTSPGSFHISGIPTVGAAALTLSYKQNGQSLKAEASGTGVTTTDQIKTVLGSYTMDISCVSDNTFAISFSGNTSKNVRLDDIEVKVKTAVYTNYVTVCDDDQVRVTYDANGGSAPSCTSGVTTKSASYTICSTEPTRTGYDFKGWKSSVDNNTYAKNASYNLQASVTFTAQWEAQEYTITYKDEGDTDYSGTNDGDLVGTHTYGSATDLVDGDKGVAYRFDGWYTTSACTGDPITSLGATDYTADITLYAKWTALYCVNWIVDGEDKLTYVAPGSALTFPKDPNVPTGCSGKTFVGWKAGDDIDGETDTPPTLIVEGTTVNANAAYRAVFALSKGGTPIDAVEDDSFTSKDEEGAYGSSTFSFKAVDEYLQKQSIWTSSQMANVKVRIRVYHFSNSKADVLHVSLINSSGTEVVGADLKTTKFGSNISSGGYSDYVDLIPTSEVTGYKVYLKTKNSNGVGINKIEREVVDTYEDYATLCCTYYSITGAGSSGTAVTGGTVTSSKNGGCEGSTVTLTATPASGYTWDGSWTITNTSTEADVTTTVLGDGHSGDNPATMTMQDYGVTVATSFSEIPVTAWSWTKGGDEVPDPLVVYVGQKVQLDVSYTPSDIINAHKSYSRTHGSGGNTYITTTLAMAYCTVKGNKAKNDETLTLQHVDDTSGDWKKVINVEVRALPTDTFVDLVHGIETIYKTAVLENSDYDVNFTYTIPGGDVDDWSSTYSNTCEQERIHLIGWVESDWAEEHLGDVSMPDTDDITESGKYHAVGGELTASGKKYYAVWAKVE